MALSECQTKVIPENNARCHILWNWYSVTTLTFCQNITVCFPAGRQNSIHHHIKHSCDRVSIWHRFVKCGIIRCCLSATSINYFMCGLLCKIFLQLLHKLFRHGSYNRHGFNITQTVRDMSQKFCAAFQGPVRKESNRVVAGVHSETVSV